MSKSLVDFNSKPCSRTCSISMIGKDSNYSFNVSKTLHKDYWVINFGLINHMILYSPILTSYVSLLGNHITVSNGICI